MHSFTHSRSRSCTHSLTHSLACSNLNDVELLKFIISKESQSVIKSCVSPSPNQDCRKIAIKGLGELLIRVWILVSLGEENKHSGNNNTSGIAVETTLHFDSLDDARKATDDLLEFILEVFKDWANEVAGNLKASSNDSGAADELSFEVVAVIYDVFYEVFERYYLHYDSITDWVYQLVGVIENSKIIVDSNYIAQVLHSPLTLIRH